MSPPATAVRPRKPANETVAAWADAVRHDGELVAPQTGHDIRTAQDMLDSCCHHNQKLVPGMVSQGVVDFLEAIKVADQ